MLYNRNEFSPKKFSLASCERTRQFWRYLDCELVTAMVAVVVAETATGIQIAILVCPKSASPKVLASYFARPFSRPS